MNEKQKIINRISKGLPNEENASLFGCEFGEELSNLIFISVPWDATTSYRPGTSNILPSLLEASHQLDLEDSVLTPAYHSGLCLDDSLFELHSKNQKTRTLVEEYRITPSDHLQKSIDENCSQMVSLVEKKSLEYLAKNKTIGLIGGDHSTSLGLIKALSKHYSSFGILHIDAHLDLRKAYEGFTFSHASIMYNVTTMVPEVEKIFSLGIRDFSNEEKNFLQENKKLESIFSSQFFHKIFSGISVKNICDEIISVLPQNVYISFDIDGLDQPFCPHTGTPVPGGISYQHAEFLLNQLALSDKKIIGFDLVEAVPDPTNNWDENVAARMLYKLGCAAMH